MLDKLLQWDRDIFIYLNGLGVEKYDAFWSAVTDMNTWIPLHILFIFLLFKLFPRKEAFTKLLWIIGLIVFITVITNLTKVGIARLRPNNDPTLNTFIRILRTPKGFSFFSGHSSSSFSVTMLIFLFLRNKIKWALIFFIWPLLFALSRIYLGVHFPLDVIVGALVGILSAILFYKLYNRFHSVKKLD